MREYVDHRHLALYQMLGEGTQEEPPFDEILVTNVSLLGDTEDEVQERIAELAERGVRVRAVDGIQDPSKRTAIPGTDGSRKQHRRR